MRLKRILEKIRYLEILFDSMCRSTFGNDGNASFNLKSDANLSSTFAVFLSYFKNFIVFKKQWITRLSPGTVGRSKGTVCSYCLKKDNKIDNG